VPTAQAQRGKKRKSAAALEEQRRKKICVEFEKENGQDISDILDTIDNKDFGQKKSSKAYCRKDITAGDYVFVLPDLSPGKLSHGG
jgi:hypothetical protein